MPDAGLIVLKFGGSILSREDSLRLVVHEIYRWHREGHRVVAVVSAAEGETDARHAEAQLICGGVGGEALAAHVAGGELGSAARLGLHLDRAGIPSTVINPGAAAMRAVGTAVDSAPVSIDTGPIRRAHERGDVAVLPGYVATNDDARWVLLGRGGSDISALFLADALGADACRLVKDVDGLYDSDPNAPGENPERFVTAGWDDALARDGSIIQHKAVEYAKGRGLPFQLGRLNGVEPTTIGTETLSAGVIAGRR